MEGCNTYTPLKLLSGLDARKEARLGTVYIKLVCINSRGMLEGKGALLDMDVCDPGYGQRMYI